MSEQTQHPVLKAISEAIDELNSDHNMRRDRPYNGQPHTDQGERGRQIVYGLTMRDIRDCLVRAYFRVHKTLDDDGNDIQPNKAFYDEALKGEDAVLSPGDLYLVKDDIDPNALGNALGCEIEKMMGIFPNFPPLPEYRQPELGRRVVCAAIRKGDAVICGARHYDETMIDAVDREGGDWRGAEQGFIDQHGEFMDRKEAWIVASAAGQVLRTVGGNDKGFLYSENLY